MFDTSEVAYQVDNLLYQFYGKSMKDATIEQIEKVSIIIATLNNKGE